MSLPPTYLFLVSVFSDHSGMKLQISTKRKTGKLNTWKLNNCLLSNQCLKGEIRGTIKKFLETNGNGNAIYQNLWDAAKVVLRGKFIAISF